MKCNKVRGEKLNALSKEECDWHLHALSGCFAFSLSFFETSNDVRLHRGRTRPTQDSTPRFDAH